MRCGSTRHAAKCEPRGCLRGGGDGAAGETVRAVGVVVVVVVMSLSKMRMLGGGGGWLVPSRQSAACAGAIEVSTRDEAPGLDCWEVLMKCWNYI